MPRGRAKACTRFAVRLDPLEGLAHQLDVFGQLWLVFHALADSQQAVLHAVQRVGNLMRDARHELTDAEHLLFLSHLGVGPIHVAADRRGEVCREPKCAGERHENSQHVDAIGRG